MKEIQVTKKATVPNGPYCVDYGSNPQTVKCDQLRSRTDSVSWGDGLGSPGTITHYTCGFFDKRVEVCYPHEDFHGLAVKKCQQCLNA